VYRAARTKLQWAGDRKRGEPRVQLACEAEERSARVRRQWESSELDVPLVLPLQKRSRLERVAPQLKDASHVGRGRGDLPEGELLVELRGAALDEREDLMVKELEVSLFVGSIGACQRGSQATVGGAAGDAPWIP